MNKNDPLCINCVHCVSRADIDQRNVYFCNHRAVRSVVHGGYWLNCQIARQPDGFCGPRGKFWEKLARKALA